MSSLSQTQSTADVCNSACVAFIVPSSLSAPVPCLGRQPVVQRDRWALQSCRRLDGDDGAVAQLGAAGRLHRPLRLDEDHEVANLLLQILEAEGKAQSHKSTACDAAERRPHLDLRVLGAGGLARRRLQDADALLQLALVREQIIAKLLQKVLLLRGARQLALRRRQRRDHVSYVRRKLPAAAKAPRARRTWVSSSLRSVARRDLSSSLFSAVSAAQRSSALEARASAAAEAARALSRSK